jgi:hypothetical protein
MEFRKHPLISYRGYPSWPPIWVGGIGLSRGKRAEGEVGRLKEVRCYRNRPGRIFLVIDYEGAEYTGCVWVDDAAFSEEVCNLLKGFYGRSVEQIGALDLPPLPSAAMTFRKPSGCQTWHFSSACSHWPQDDYAEQSGLPVTGELCNECKTLQQKSN